MPRTYKRIKKRRKKKKKRKEEENKRGKAEGRGSFNLWTV